MRTPTRLLGLLLFASFLSVVGAAVAFATTGTLSPIYQGYSTAGGGDPYSNDANPHVGGYGGQPGVTGYVRLNFESLPPGSNVDGLRLKLVPTSSTTDNINSAAAAFEACVLNSPLTSSGYQSSPPSYDCSVHAVAEAQSDGSWAIELGPLVPRWKESNTGLALVPYAPPNGTPVGVTPSAWSLAFLHEQTSARVDYTPGQPAPDSFAAAPAVTEPLPPSSSLAAPAIAPPLQLPGIGVPAVAPSAPAAAPSAAPVQPALPALVNRPRLDKQWVWVTGALVGSAVLMLLVGAGQQAFRTGRLNLGAALAASRSQLATPISVLSLAAVFSLGATTQTVAVLQPGAGGTAGANGAPGAAAAGGEGGAGTAQAGTGAGGLGPAGGPAGSAAAGSTIGGTSARNDPRNGPGVTATTVRIGFEYTVNAQAANAAFGFQTPNTGNQQAEEQALVDYVNKHGGIAGRQIQPVYVAYDNGQAESDPNINEKICIQMTEDYHVFAVIGGGGPPDDVAANACYAQHGTMNFDLEQAEPDLGFLRQTSPFIWLTSAAALDRIMKMEIAGLQQQGYFNNAATHKYGVVVAEDKLNEGVYNNVTLPALHAAGVGNNVEDFEVPHDTVSDIANTMKQAVARFQIDGVDRVIFQGGGNYGTGSYAVLFMVNAQSQGYTPTYGLSSDDGPVGLAGDVPERQLQGALAVGITPIDDTDDAHYLPWPSTPNEKHCADIEAAAGNTFSRRLDAGVILLLCNATFEFQQAAQPLASGPLNAQLWADQAMRLGSSVWSASMYRAFVGPSHWDSAGGYRLLHANQNCSGSANNMACFVYTDSNIYG